MMKRLLFILFLACAIQGMCQTQLQQWIAHPLADSTSGVWFRNTYLVNATPQKGEITISSTGHFIVYVNSCRVSSDSRNIIPDGEKEISIKYDITRYLRPDSNTIAVTYLPTSVDKHTRQIALNFSGIDADGHQFSYNTDDSWLCMLSDRELTPEGELTDNRKNLSFIWHDCTEYAPALWIHATVFPELSYCKPEHSFYPTIKKAYTLRPRYYEFLGDGIYYEFGTGFYGYIRVTIRDARKGEHIYIAGNEYICNGTTDEQAFAVFTQSYLRRPRISGDRYFRSKQIQKVEGIGLIESFHSSWLY